MAGTFATTKYARMAWIETASIIRVSPMQLWVCHIPYPRSIMREMFSKSLDFKLTLLNPLLSWAN